MILPENRVIQNNTEEVLTPNARTQKHSPSGWLDKEVIYMSICFMHIHTWLRDLCFFTFLKFEDNNKTKPILEKKTTVLL